MTTATTSPHGIESAVCFTLGGRSYATDVAIVREVVNVAPAQVLRVAQTPEPIAGIFSLRGAAIALVHTHTLLGLDGGGAAGATLIIARGHRTICGLAIEQVLGVLPFTAAKFAPADREREPPEVAGFLSTERFGVVTVLDATVVVRSLERLRFH